MAAGPATLRAAGDAVYRALDAGADRLSGLLSDALTEASVAHRISRAGNFLTVFFGDAPVTDFASAKATEKPGATRLSSTPCWTPGCTRRAVPSKPGSSRPHSTTLRSTGSPTRCPPPRRPPPKLRSPHTDKTIVHVMRHGEVHNPDKILYGRKPNFHLSEHGRAQAEAGFRSAPAEAAATRDVRLAWSADTLGQGWGIDRARGGLRTYETMRRLQPDLFVHCGDTIYADNPLVESVPLDDGSTWRNLVTPAKAKVAETLHEFRGNYLYNLLDDNLRRFNAEVAQLVLWDDHEVLNNWYPTERLEDPRYTEKSVALLAARAKRAFLEHNPIRHACDDLERIYRRIPYGPLLEVFAIDMRSERAANSANAQPTAGPETALLGRAQLDWLKQGLARSTAAWKVVASDMPIGLVVADGPERFEAVANGDPGPPLGRELEIAELLRFLRIEPVRNVVWITGDVHYAAAHHYDPEQARFTDFDAFWEFVAGPLHDGTFGPAALDPTFGPAVRFQGIPAGMKPNRPPSEGLQFFGTLDVDPRSRALTARLHDVAGRVLYGVELPPAR